MTARWIWTTGCASVLVCAGAVEASRLYGTANIIYQRSYRTDGTQADSSSLPTDLKSRSESSQETLLLNYEDVLFGKNALRLGASIYRYQLENSSRHDVRPIYSLDIRSNGYALSTSYSPYKQLSGFASGPSSNAFNYNVFYRDWRNTISVNYPKYPSAQFIYNSARTFDQQTPRRADSRGTTTAFESAYVLKGVSTRINYSQLRQENLVSSPTISKLRSYTGVVSYGHMLKKLGYLSANYSYYDTRSTRPSDGDALLSLIKTHSLSGVYSSPQVAGLSLSSSYSGRFSSIQTTSYRSKPRDESVSGQVTYSPLSYLEFDALQTYQQSVDTELNRITEYTSIATNVTHSLRQGVDTRVSANRTWFERSSQTSLDNPRGRYNIDTYYGSLGVSPWGYVKTLLDVSLSRNSRPLVAEQKYQLSRSISAQLYFSRRVEGRLTALWLDQAASLRLNNSYSVSYNGGMTYYPVGNLSVNLSYIYSSINSGNGSKTGAFAGFASYAFRNAYSFYVSLNRQMLETPSIQSAQNRVTLKPYSVNAYVQIFASRKTTLTLGYLYTHSVLQQAIRSIGRQYTATLNVQI